MKKFKKTRVIAGAACIALIASLAFVFAESKAEKKAIGWQRYDHRTESCVSGRTTCIIP